MPCLPAILAAFIILFLHWFPWRMLLNGCELERLWAYALGTVVIVGVSCGAYWYLGMVEAACILLAVAGAATLAGYTVDSAIERSHLERDAQHRRDTYGDER